MNKLFSLTLLVLTGFTATSRCMEPFDMPFQEQSAVPTLKQLVSTKIANNLIQPENLKKFIDNPDYIQGLSFNAEVSQAIATQIVKKTIIPKSFFKTDSLLPKSKLPSSFDQRDNSVAFSCDGKHLAFNSYSKIESNQLSLYNITDQQATPATRSYNCNDTSSVAFSSNHNRYLVYSIGTTILLYDIEEQQPIAQLEDACNSSVNSVALSDRYLASASSSACLYDITGEQPQFVAQLKDAPGYVNSVALSDRYLASAHSAHRDETVCLYNITGKQPKLIAQLKDHSDTVRSVALSDKYLASASDDNTVCLYDITGEQPQFVAQLKDHVSSVQSVSFSHDGRYLASASWDKTICLYNITGEQPQFIIQIEDISNLNSIAFSNDNRYLASSSYKSLCTYNITEAFHEFADFIAMDLLLEHALLLRACFKNKISLLEHPHLREYFFKLPQAIQEYLVDQKHIKVMKTKDLIKLVESRWENQK